MVGDTRKTVLITGCSSGIGDSYAREFHSKGLRVFATARKAESLVKLRQLGIETFSLEVTDPESIAQLKVDVSRACGGKLDILVNNAGMNMVVPALDLDIPEVEHMFNINVYSVMRICQAFAPMLIEAKGTILQMGSVAGITPYTFSSAYNASKAALLAYSNTLRIEVAPFGVDVVVTITGGVQSSIARADRKLTPESVYMPINPEYTRRVKHSQAGAMPSDTYAKSVVSQVLRENPPRFIWEGNKSWIIWFFTTFTPQSVLDYGFSSMFSLSKLAGTYVPKVHKA